MQKMFIAMVLCLILIAQSVFATAPTRPFPQAGRFTLKGDVIRPDFAGQGTLNNLVIEKYNLYKTHLRTSGNMRYIQATGTSTASNSRTISEAHGYGMIVFALMAGHDPEARAIFDGMNEFRKRHPSTINNRLMAWYVNTVGQVPSDGTAATDGDLDMAYALLLAYDQWGDERYLDDARSIIRGIRESLIGANSRRVLLGDWARYSDQNGMNTRTSDWRPAHFRAFARAESQHADFWTSVSDTVYALLAQVANPSTGLMPDFVTGRPARADGNCGNATEGAVRCDQYSFNACRTPWQLAIDYAHYGTPGTKAHLTRIVNWIKGQPIGGVVGNVLDGYYLDGRVLTGGGWGTQRWYNVVFAAPFTSAMIATNEQALLNSFFRGISGHDNQGFGNAGDVYQLGVQLLNMLLITGNWWAPLSEVIIPPADEVLLDYTEAEWSSNASKPTDTPPGDGLHTDNLGSWARIDENNTDDGILRFTMNVAPSNSETNTWAWASIGTFFPAGDFPSDATRIDITYTASHSFNLTLFGTSPGIAGYARHFNLSAATTETTVSIDMADFQFPEWGDDFPTPQLNKAHIEGIFIEAISQDKGVAYQLTGRITALQVVAGSGGGGETSISAPLVSAAPRTTTAGISIANRNLNLNIPSERAVSVGIYDVRGRLLFNRDITLNSGTASLALPTGVMANQVLIINVKGQNGLNMSRRILAQ